MSIATTLPTSLLPDRLRHIAHVIPNSASSSMVCEAQADNASALAETSLVTSESIHSDDTPENDDVVEVELGATPTPRLESLTVRQLRSMAAERNVQLAGATTKKEIVSRLTSRVDV